MPLRNEDGDVSAVLCIARDITENKMLERQLINTEKLASLGPLAPVLLTRSITPWVLSSVSAIYW